ncbi:retention module-containing protein [Pseudomonas kilonensis]|uniref:Type I secretion C-terminal target domain (VC_A0849 subclass) n=1 Tax=Pseudomonas kilonensis TaxID=132476 RepID=A0ABY0Z6I5_9PSED|nr:retention module-containing protein [Pseudomonas kilonensis]SEE36486.1 type I secretion C-terminal target domain (VC_A0849 subclass) [Pseudomonas kilonensis]
MAALIGIVSKVVGQVFAEAAGGLRRPLVEGDRLYAGEHLVTGAEGAVAVHMQNGQTLTLGRESNLTLTPQLLANHAPHVDTPDAAAPSDAQLTDVQKLQQAIAAGADPTQTGEATAAGPEGGNPGGVGGGHSFVLLEEVGGEVDPLIGFPTAGFNGIPEFPPLRLAGDPDNTGDDATVPPVTPDNPVTLDGVNVEGGELTTNEANLADGSASNPGALVQNGTFTVSAPDGLSSLSIGGINVISGGVPAGFPQTITSPLGNTLTITGYDPATGVVSYSYTLTDNEIHPAGGGANNITEQFPVVAVDTDGDTATGTLDVNITDDVPQAIDDSHANTASETLVTLTGNVLPNDHQGADRIPTGPDSGPIIGGTFTGTYGTLVLNPNGTYTYILNTSDPQFVALHGGGSGTETFTYTLTDADGDTSTANLVLQVHNNDDPVVLVGLDAEGGELSLQEKNLSDGSSPDASALTQSGTFTVTALDGVQTLIVGGINVVTGGVAAGFPQSITTALGNTLTITGFNAATGVVSYSYTLLDNEAHPNANGANSLSEQFAVVVTDDNGTTSNGNLDVNIVDDLPKAVDDSNASTASETNLTLTGSVLTNDTQGADHVASGPITPGTFTGTYGTLVLNADGSYTYTLNTADADFKGLHGGGNGSETFTYTLTDADGDTSTANLVLQVHNNDDPVIITGLDTEGGELSLQEKNLSDGSSPDASALTQSGTFTVTALDGVQTLSVGGINVVTGGVAAGFPQSITTALGNTLTITGFNAATGVVSYSYTLLDNEAHPNANGANSLSEQFAVVVTDDNGTTANGNLDVNIVDDLPKAVDDSNASTASETNLTLTGSVLTNDTQGADHVASGPITPGTFTGTYGTLVLNADGSYTYTLNTADADFKGLHGGGNGSETFTYTLTDADGDTSTANLVLQVHNNDDPVIITGLDSEGGELSLQEKNLSDGSSPDASALTQSGTFTVTALDGVQTLSVGGINVVTGGVAAGFPQSITTALGNTLTITGFNAATGVVSYSYTLLDNEAHPNANGANSLSEQFAVVVTDDNGTTANGNLDVNIVDDLPTAHADSASVDEGGTVSGNVLNNDEGGADGPAASGAVIGVRAGNDTLTPAIGGLNTQINGTYGYLTLDANGNAVYHSNPNTVSAPGATDVFTYTVRDADGDESTTTITIDVHDVCLVATPDQEISVHEKALDLTQDGQDLAPGTVTGSDPSATSETASGSLVGSISGAVGAVTFALVGNANGAYGQLSLQPDGSYTYTLTSPATTTPNANDGPNVLSESFTYQATDSLGNTVTSTIVIDIVDDVPNAHADFASVVEGGTVNGNVLDNDVLGADGGMVIGVRAGNDTSNPAVGGLNTQINGTYGYLTLDANGNAVYHSNPNTVSAPGATDVFTYTVRDADGDESTTTITIDVHDVCLVATPDQEISVHEKALDLNQDGQDLAPGIVTGSDPTATSETASGSLVGSISGAVGAVTFALVGNATGAYGQLSLQPDGSYTYTLTSPATTTPNANDGPNVLSESFTYQATDSLGNTVTSTIVIDIVDDVPNAHADFASVVEGGTVNGNVLDNDVLGADGGMVIGVRAGNDTSTSAVGGLNNQINGTYGYLTLDANGNAVYHSNPDAVGAAGATDVFTYTVRDADGDESTTTLTIDVHNSCLIAETDHDITVYEKALDLTQDGQDLAPGTVTGSDPSATSETASGTLVGSISGATGAVTFTLVGSASGAYGQLLLHPDGSYTYTLTSPATTTPHANDGPNVLSEDFTYQATDTLGNSTTGNLVVSIVDDVPTAIASERSVTAVEIDTNLLIVLDVSGSMKDASGVSGLSRMDLAKQAISALLDKYDDLGDVKVQLVTFSGSATDQSTVWVDVATAKTLISALSAHGDTNYDAAVAMAKTAFANPGQLTGAQNVGYFFSDGKPTLGEIGSADETAWKAFLDANGIKNYAIGLGSGVSNAHLDPLAYDGSAHTNTNAVVVTDLNQLNSVLSDTVQGAPVTGNLLGEGGSFGADGGFIKSLVVDGTTYSYDPAANGGHGALTASGGLNHGSFNTATNTLSIATDHDGTLVVNLDTGAFSYTSQTATGTLITEHIGYTVSDHDGDLASSNLVINVVPNSPPIAVDDNIITNVLSGNIVIPGELLLGNDSDANGDPLTASPTSFNTGWTAKGGDFTGSTGTVSFTGNNVQSINLSRSAFVANTASMTAMLVVSGALGMVSNNNANDEDRLNISLKQGETLTLDHNLSAGRIAMEYSLNGGPFIAINDGASFTAAADGNYQIHVTNIPNPGGGNSNAAENYQLTLTVDYAGAQDKTPDYHGSYTASDNHGGSDSASVDISYQAGHTLTGTTGDDVLIAGNGDNTLNAGDGNDILSAGSGNNTLHGGAGDDLLYSGAGNDLLDGGTGNDTASYAHATAGVTVNLGLLAAQNTLGAGTDTLAGIENLMGSSFNDTLTGDGASNRINGGLGHDVLNGGGGDDLLIGGLGNNTLTGGSGADTFQWQAGNSGHDVITDFAPGVDKLDLSQLLQGENGSAASLDDYLHFSVSGSGTSVVTSIDVSAIAGATPNQTIDLTGVNLASHYGVTPGAGGIIGGADTATIINGMLSDHSLRVDTV